MARVKLVYKPSDYPNPDAETQQALKQLFDHMFPGQARREIPGKSGAFATVTQSPKLAYLLVKVSDYMVGGDCWSGQRNPLRQLMIQRLNQLLNCEFAFQSHIRPAEAQGVTVEQQACLAFWRRTSGLFSDEQRLVLEFTEAVVAGEVPEELFARVVRQYGERGAVEFTVAVAWWSFWGMIINATGTSFDFGYGKVAAAG